jgi:hypothetical protein
MFGFGINYCLVFHDTESPNDKEQDILDSLDRDDWESFGYGRKYDGKSFELGSLLSFRKSDANSNPILAEIFSPEFTKWMNTCYRDSSRYTAQFCTLLISRNHYRRAISDSLCDIKVSSIASIRIGDYVIDNLNDIKTIASSFQTINPYLKYRDFSPRTPFVIEQKLGDKYAYNISRVASNKFPDPRIIINFASNHSFCSFVCVSSKELVTIFENMGISF